MWKGGGELHKREMGEGEMECFDLMNGPSQDQPVTLLKQHQNKFFGKSLATKSMLIYMSMIKKITGKIHQTNT